MLRDHVKYFTVIFFVTFFGLLTLLILSTCGETEYITETIESHKECQTCKTCTKCSLPGEDIKIAGTYSVTANRVIDNCSFKYTGFLKDPSDETKPLLVSVTIIEDNYNEYTLSFDQFLFGIGVEKQIDGTYELSFKKEQHICLNASYYITDCEKNDALLSFSGYILPNGELYALFTIWYADRCGNNYDQEGYFVYELKGTGNKNNVVCSIYGSYSCYNQLSCHGVLRTCVPTPDLCPDSGLTQSYRNGEGLCVDNPTKKQY